MYYLNTAEIKEINNHVLCWLATTSKTGQPNVSPKEMFICINSATVIIGNISSPASIRNIRTNRKVCCSTINIFKQKGYKIYGEATIHDKSSELFLYLKELLHNRYGYVFKIKSIIEIRITSVSKILAPSYQFNLSKSEDDMIADAKKTYRLT